MSTSGEQLVQLLAATYLYSPPNRLQSTSTSIRPYRPAPQPLPSRLPVFVVHSPELKDKLITSLASTLTTDIENSTLDFLKVLKCCKTFTDYAACQGYPHFRRRDIATERDVTAIATILEDHLKDVIKIGYRNKLQFQEQRSLSDQRPARFLTVGGAKRVVWEDMPWRVFDLCAADIVQLAQSDQGRQLEFCGEEKHGRAILFKMAVAMYDTECHWAVVFGGDGVLLLQRVSSEVESRYGIVCSGVLPIKELYILVLATLLVPGDIPLINLVHFAIPTPSPCLAPDVQQLSHQNTASGLDGEVSEEDVVDNGSTCVRLYMDLPGYHPNTLILNTASACVRHPESPSDSPQASKLPNIYSQIHVTELPFIGATGTVFQGATSGSPLIIKAIPPGWSGVPDLVNEANVYGALGSLQGTAVPRFYGHFEGEGWAAIVLEECGTAVGDLDGLSRAQREQVLEQARALHGCGVIHNDLELRNIVKAPSGAVRIIDFAYSASGHECAGEACSELFHFSRLLGLLPKSSLVM
ncbi:hypothetical protein DFH06DRAFT_1306157 [Mycena polygramma]|nr:hypothetical protein DFH06DRAFT_1306157 [Mycena polygramma]